MLNFRLVTSLLDYTPSATSVDSACPASNLALYGRLFKKYAALVATGVVDVTLDVGIGNTVSGLAANPALFLDDMNVTSLRIQGNSVTTNWDTPPWDQTITVAKHEGVGRYKDFRRLLDLSLLAFDYRYLNIRIPSQTPTDGANYHIGRIGIGQIRELTSNPSYDSELTIEQRVIDTELADGGSETNLMGAPYALFQFPKKLLSAAARDEHWSIDAIGKGQPFVLWDASEGGTQDAWMVKRIETSQLRKEFDAYYTTQWRLREVI